MISAWAGKDWQAAAVKALDLEPKGYLINSVIQVVEPDEALKLHDFLKEKNFDKNAPDQFANLFFHLYHLGAENAAEKALTHLRSRSQSHWGDHGLKSILRSWIKDDPEAALKWVEGQSSGADKDLAMNSLIDAWVGRDSVDALNVMWYQMDANQRNRMVQQLGNGSASAIDTAEVLTWLDGHVEAPEWRNKILSGLTKGLRNSFRNPQQLAELVPHLDSSDYGTKAAITEAARRWAESDLNGLSAWMESIEDEGVRGAVLGGTIKQLASREPNKALEYLSDESIGDEVASMLSQYDFGRLLQTANEVPKDLIEQLPGAIRDKALAGYAQAFAEEKPAEVLSYLESMPEGEARNNGIQKSVSHWATVAPQEAAAWVDDLPEGTLRRNAALNLASNWSNADLASALEWLGTMPPGQSRDAAAHRAGESASLS